MPSMTTDSERVEAIRGAYEKVVSCGCCDEDLIALGEAIASLSSIPAQQEEPHCYYCGWAVPDDYSSRYCGSCAQDMIWSEVQAKSAQQEPVAWRYEQASASRNRIGLGQ